jgi:hypothetical protein
MERSNMMSQPLCPDLFERLARHFGTVRIANAGQPLVFADPAAAPPQPGRRARLEVASPGEDYRVRCCYCADAGFHLGIHHRWAEFRHLAICYRRDCLRHPARRQDLYLRVFRSLRPRALPVRPAAPEPEAHAPPPLPAGVSGLADLPPGHPAVAYVAGRGFDPAALARLDGVGYAAGHDPDQPAAHGRLIVPLRDLAGRPRGWQGRAIAGRGPRYFTAPGTHKSRLLYCGDLASGWPFVVIAEGVTDVWAVGPPAVALLGQAASKAQLDLLRRWPAAVVLLDADAGDAAAELAAELGRQGVRRVVVQLPEGQDPASLGREAVWRLIHAAAREQGLLLAPAVPALALGVGPGPVAQPPARAVEAAAGIDEPEVMRALLVGAGVDAADDAADLPARLEAEGLLELFRIVELPALPAVRAMAAAGVPLSVPWAEGLLEDLRQEAARPSAAGPAAGGGAGALDRTIRQVTPPLARVHAGGRLFPRLAPVGTITGRITAAAPPTRRCRPPCAG